MRLEKLQIVPQDRDSNWPQSLLYNAIFPLLGALARRKTSPSRLNNVRQKQIYRLATISKNMNRRMRKRIDRFSKWVYFQNHLHQVHFLPNNQHVCLSCLSVLKSDDGACVSSIYTTNKEKRYRSTRSEERKNIVARLGLTKYDSKSWMF